MALDPITRARIIIDLVQDGTTSDDNLYTPVDKASGSDALAIADAYIEKFGPVVDNVGVEILNPTNVQKAQFYINQVRSQHRITIVDAVKDPAVAQAVIDATAAGNATADTVLGMDEF